MSAPSVAGEDCRCGHAGWCHLRGGRCQWTLCDCGSFSLNYDRVFARNFASRSVLGRKDVKAVLSLQAWVAAVALPPPAYPGDKDGGR